MARPLSTDKRNALLDAATEIVATLGTAAPTSKIAQRAAVAEGTLFTYFSDKNDLLNQLYIQLKTDYRDAVMTGYPADKPLLDRARFFWDRSVAAAIKHPHKRKALNQLAVSDLITEKSRALCGEYFVTIKDMLRECTAKGVVKNQPPAFALAIMNAIADATIGFIEREPARAKHYTKAGFDAFWKAVSS
jgi:AcrR family transcriptional regulator